MGRGQGTCEQISGRGSTKAYRVDMATPNISAQDVRELRQRTGAGMMDCKKALTEAGGDAEKAIEILSAKQGKKVQSLSQRTATEGTIQHYGHPGGKLAVMVQVDCNTDFVAQNSDFVAFAHELAVQIAGTPTVRYVSRDEVPAKLISDEKRRYKNSAIHKARSANKPAKVCKQILDGHMEAWLKELTLQGQVMHNPKFGGQTVEQLRDALAAKTGENIVIRRFIRFAL